MDFCVSGWDGARCPGCRNDTGGRGGRGPRCKWIVEWHGRSRIHANSIYLLAVLSFAIFTARKMSCEELWLWPRSGNRKVRADNAKARCATKRPLRMWRRHEKARTFSEGLDALISPKLRKSEGGETYKCDELLHSAPSLPKYCLTSTPSSHLN